MLGDIRSIWLLYAKGLLFLICGIAAVTLILIEYPSLKLAFLMGLAIWCFCRAYYFVFYVIEHYADPEYKFAGIIAFLRYLYDKRKR